MNRWFKPKGFTFPGFRKNNRQHLVPICRVEILRLPWDGQDIREAVRERARASDDRREPRVIQLRLNGEDALCRRFVIRNIGRAEMNFVGIVRHSVGELMLFFGGRIRHPPRKFNIDLVVIRCFSDAVHHAVASIAFADIVGVDFAIG